MSAFTTAFYGIPKTVQTVIEALVAELVPQRVILFGSRARGDHRENSDFDIAIEGKTCTDEQWRMTLAKIADSPFTLFPLDVVEVETLSSEYRKNIEKEGVTLYEAN